MRFWRIMTEMQEPGKNRGWEVVKRGSIGVVGFILSPLSWWNDLLVNFPLAYGFAWGAGRIVGFFVIVHQWMFVYLFVTGYFITNLVGFLMLHYSLFGSGKGTKPSYKKQIAISVFYTLIIVAFFGAGLCNPEQGCVILPPWVEA